MKTTSHSLMAKGIMVLLSLLILVFIFTYSWFVPPEYPATASGLSFSTVSDIDFDMAIGFETKDTGHYVVSNFTSTDGSIDFTKIRVSPQFTIGTGDETITINNDIVLQTQAEQTQGYKEYNLLSYFSPIDLTGDGTTLVRPFMNFKNRGINVDENTVKSVYDDNVEFISFDIIVRSKTPQYDISLVEGSYVISAAEAYPGRDPDADEEADTINYAISHNIAMNTTPNADRLNTFSQSNPLVRPSTYGVFSEDSVVGAVRVGFTKYDNPVAGNSGNAAEDAATTANRFFGRAISNNVYDNNNLVASKAFAYTDPADKTDPDLLWIPRTDIYLQNNFNDTSGDETSTGWVLYDSEDAEWDNSLNTVKDATDTAYYQNSAETPAYELTSLQHDLKYKEAASEHIYYNKDNINNANIDSRFTRLTTANTEYLKAGLDLSGNDSIIEEIYTDGEWYYGKCHVNLWIEGCDAEARRAVDGGLFFFGFALNAKA